MLYSVIKRISLAGALILGASAMLVGSEAFAQSSQNFSWQKYSGTTIRVMFDSHPWQKFIEPLVPQFEKLTGIHVQVQVYPEDQFRQKLLLDLSSGSSAVDGFMFMPAQNLALYHKENWVAPLNTYLSNPEMTPASWNYSDFFSGVRSRYAVGGKTYGIPLHVETFTMFYRKDLFKKFGLQPPQTMQQLANVAKALKVDLKQAGDSGVYPLVMRGKTPDATSSMVNFLFSFGGHWFNANGKCALDSKASQKALTFYANLLRKYGPPSATSNSWQVDTELFSQGKAAILYDSNVFKTIVSDPQTSKVANDVGYAPLPAGPDGKRHPTALTWGLGINSASQHKDATWYFIEWALNKGNQLGYLQAGGPSARASAWQSAAFRSSSRYSKAWVDASDLQYSIASGDWNPPVINVQAGRNAYGLAIVGAIEGGSVPKLLNTACQHMNQVVKEFGR